MASYRRIVQLKYLQKLRERDKCSTNPRCKVSSSEDERCSSVESFKQSGNCLCEVFLKRGFITRYRGKLLYRTTAPPLPIVNTINCGDASVGKCRYKHASISYRTTPLMRYRRKRAMCVLRMLSISKP